MARYVRVLVIDDSALARDMLTDALNADAEIIVVGRRRDGSSAVAAARRLRPDLITMDVNMPGVDGYEAVRQIMAFQPTPILVVTAVPTRHSDVVPRMLAAGALDVVEKPSGPPAQLHRQVVELVDRIKRLAQVRVVTHLEGRRPSMQAFEADEGPAATARVTALHVVGIVASTGGPSAVTQILAELDRSFGGAIVVVQHIAPGFTGGFVDWLRRSTRLAVDVARDGAPLTAGLVLVAPENVHTQVGGRGEIQLLAEPASGLRPSGDVLLRSLAASHGSRAIGVVLTGMGDDGARGLAAIRKMGGRTIAQDERTSTIYGMPQVAMQIGAAEEILPLPEISARLRVLVGVD